MKRPVTMLLAATLALAVPLLGAASERVVGSSRHTDRETANEALDRAASNSPEDADPGLSTAREAVNNNGVGERSRTTGARNRSSRGSSAGGSGSRGGSRGGGRGR